MDSMFKKQMFPFRPFSAIGILAIILVCSWPLSTLATTLICNSNPDYFTKRCTVHPNAITRIEDGKMIKGHLVGCQFKSFSCFNNVCKDNFGAAMFPFSFPMTDLDKFCELLCKNPSCTTAWQ